ncbi:MAG: hypothetical protein KDD01_10690 [Phaeodactylibacter sp.]|nr:hypothetical protein [Phaeodactylibacter sp.]
MMANRILACLFSISIILNYSCDPICEAPVITLPPPEPEICDIENHPKDSLFITGFEKGENPTEWGGNLNPWKDSLSSVQVAVDYFSLNVDLIHGEYAAQVTIDSNFAETSAADWSGGGMSLEFSSCPEGIDISAYQFLKFDIKTTAENGLELTKVKLEDTSRVKQPELLILSYQAFTTEWATVSIPLERFIAAAGNQVPLQLENVTRLLTTSINTTTIPANVKGVLFIDNVRFTN